MRKRNVLFVGFSLGYFWHWFKPIWAAGCREVVKANRVGMEEYMKKWLYGPKETDRPKARPAEGQRIVFPYHNPQQYRPSRGIFTDTGRKSILFRNTNEAQEVLEKMLDLIDKYQTASVADLYDLAGIPASRGDKQWGWATMEDAKVRQIATGWLLDLPDPHPLVNVN